MRFFFIFIFCNIFATVSFSQNKITDLPEISVIGTLQNQSVIKSGRNIIIITKQQIEKMAAQSIDEILKFTPGVEVQMRGNQGSQSDILMRGGTFQQVLILVDGVRLNDPLTGHFNGNIPVHPNEVERIEVLKGTASSLYGADAVGGVINVITKSSSYKKIASSIRFQIGEFGLRTGSIFLQTNTKQHYTAFSANSNNADGQKFRGTQNFFNNNNFSGKYIFTSKNNWQFGARVVADFRKFNAQNFYTSFVSDTANEKVNSFTSIISINKKTNNYTWHTDFSFKKLRDQFLFNSRSIANDNKSQQIIAQSFLKFNEKNNTSGLIGLQFIKKQIKSNDRGNHTVNHAAIIGNLSHKITKEFSLQEGIRIDMDQRYGTVVVPQLTINYLLKNVSFRAMAGRSIRDADFTERYNNYGKVLVTGGSIGNPDLKTETAWNIEIGATIKPNSNFTIATTVFKKWHKNLIDYFPTTYINMPRKVNLIPTGNYALTKNIAQLNSTGFELDIQYQKQIKDLNIFVSSGLLHLISKNSDPIPSFYISGHAKWQVNGMIVLGYKNLSITNQILYKKRNAKQALGIGAYVKPEYLVLHIKSIYNFPKNKVSIFMQLDNVGNQSYQDILGAKLPNRWLSFGLSLGL